MGTTVYNVKNVDLSINGLRLSGFGDEMVNVTTISDAVTTSVGADGNMEGSTTNDDRSTVSITLQQTSTSNTTLSLIPIGAKLAFTLSDRTDGLTKVAGEGFVTKRPDIVRGREVNSNVWTLVINETSGFVGGVAPVAIIGA